MILDRLFSQQATCRLHEGKDGRGHWCRGDLDVIDREGEIAGMPLGFALSIIKSYRKMSPPIKATGLLLCECHFASARRCCSFPFLRDVE